MCINNFDRNTNKIFKKERQRMRIEEWSSRSEQEVTGKNQEKVSTVID